MKRSLGARTLLYPTPVLLVGSYDKDGKANAMTVAWAGICCSSPPCLAVSLRKATYTYGSIMERRAFTVNIPSEEQVAQADFLGMASGRDEDKLAKAGMTPVKSVLVDAPYLRECPIVLECKVKHITEIGLHTQFIGEILDVKVEESALDEKGSSSIKMAKPFLYAPDDRNYYSIGELLAKGFDEGKRIKDRSN